MKFFFYSFFFLFLISCKSYEFQNDYKRTTESYKINAIGKTEKYYVLRTFNDNGSGLLVIEKKSKQLRGKKLKIGNTYSYNTYSFFDTVALGGIMCHEVEGIKIWCSDDGIDLRFTDSQGNEIIEF